MVLPISDPFIGAYGRTIEVLIGDGSRQREVKNMESLCKAIL
jgi:hypothetical protein